MSSNFQFAVAENGHWADPNKIDRTSHPAYLERVYAGVLGKLIGVYLGRPVEGWPYEKITEEFGTVDFYIHEQRGRLLIVTDDDISGTFTFLRALEDYGFDPNLTSEQIGQTWLNYLIEKTTVLWWGGLGNSTEHTAYLRLKSGIKAPRSGSCELNSKILSEQIGAQIFIDGWGLICPGDPARAASFADRAARVSHDGEAVYGAKIIAAMVAEAFVESDLDRLLDKGLEFIPPSSTVSKLISDVRDWHRVEKDWRANRERLQAEYGYDKYLGQCHLIPNHGLIILSLLHGAGDFDESMAIVNTAGWDTDCNSGNVGAILGVRNGLAAFEKRDWRGPVADRLYLPSADGGRAIADAAQEAVAVVNAGRALDGLPPLAPKDGARFTFELPGSVQGWRTEQPADLRLSRPTNSQGLLIESRTDAPARVFRDTFIPPEAKDMKTGYVLVANPLLYPGHTVKFQLRGASPQSAGRLYFAHYDENDESRFVEGPVFDLGESQELTLEWKMPETGGYPIHEIGIELRTGRVVLEQVDWKGIPDTSFPNLPGTMAARAWARSVDRFEYVRDRYDYLCQNEGVGLLTQGSRDWQDYRVECRFTPKMAEAAGVAVRVQGLRRYYAVVFGAPGEICIIKALDGDSTLARTSFPWEQFRDYELEVEVKGNEIRAWVDGRLTLTAVDMDRPLTSGAFGFLIHSGCGGAGTPRICPA
ncbi:MAG: ADP-ribosylglycohydrolase family protein [Armatimonadetes bacterium]|nr:ADP-ribosylglycohydrolase family protein [Armatimonadota bacterium]